MHQPPLTGPEILGNAGQFLADYGLTAAAAALHAINAARSTVIGMEQRAQLAALTFEERGYLVCACALTVTELSRSGIPVHSDALQYVHALCGALVLACVQIDVARGQAAAPAFPFHSAIGASSIAH